MIGLLLTFIGLLLGLLGGALVGIGAGLAWISYFNVSDFEGQSAAMVFLTFMPTGAVVGSLAGVVLFARAAARSAGATPPPPSPLGRQDG